MGEHTIWESEEFDDTSASSTNMLAENFLNHPVKHTIMEHKEYFISSEESYQTT